MRFENFHIQKDSAESASPESICFDAKSSVIFDSGYFVVKAFIFQRLKFPLHFNRRKNALNPVNRNCTKFQVFCNSSPLLSVLGNLVSLWNVNVQKNLQRINDF